MKKSVLFLYVLLLTLLPLGVSAAFLPSGTDCEPSPVVERHVAICDGQSFTIHGKPVTKSGVYFDTLTDQSGCDSVVRYSVTVHSAYQFHDTVSICYGDTFTFNGRKLSADGDYYATYKTVDGCDSIRHLHLSVRPSYLFIIDTTVCGNSFYFRNRTLTESGVYYDSLTTKTGCDSIFRLNLRLNSPSPVTDVHQSVCQGDSFYIRGKLIPTTDIYYDTLLNIVGCDSVVRYIFNVHSSYQIYDTVSICQGDYYQFGTRKLTTSGDYVLNYKTINGCDSILHLHLTANPTYVVPVDTFVCGDFFIFNNHTYKKSGIYYDTLTTVNGCDSVCRINLTLTSAPPVANERVNICYGDSFVIAGKSVTRNTVIYDTLKSYQGCDSIVRYIVTVNPTYHYFDTASICRNQSYQYHGLSISVPGDYVQRYETTKGCDSVFHLHLRVSPSFLISKDTTVCGQSFTFHDVVYTKSGVYDDTLRSVTGCDSIYRINLTLYPPVITDVEINACQGDSVIIHGIHVPASGVYYDTLVSHTGCDSIIRYKFNVLASYEFHQSATICQGDSYSFFGRALTTPGDYIQSFKTINGCDSVYHLRLAVQQHFVFITDTSVCGNSFTFRGHNYTKSGVYDDTLRTTIGCDSIFRLNLTLNSNLTHDVKINACRGDSVLIHGIYVPASGIYYDTLVSRAGCDSVVRFIFNVLSTYEFHQYASICQGDSYLFHGQTLTSTGDYLANYKTAEGCDSIYHLHLTVNPAYVFFIDTTFCGTSFIYHSRSYTESGTYYDTLASATGCDSIFHINLTLNKPVFSDVEINACQGDSVIIGGRYVPASGIYCDTLVSRTGCDSIVRYKFNILNTYEFYQNAQICQGETYMFHGQVLTNAGDYTHTYKTVTGCDSVYHLHLAVSSSHLFVVDTIVCGNSFFYRNRTYTQSGIYYDTLRTSSGCDSVYQLNLTLGTPSPLTDVRISLCEGDSLIIRGRVVRTHCTFIDTLVNSYGCDSAVRYIVSVNAPYHYYDTVGICRGETYNYHGLTVTLAGDYVQAFTTSYGCDSVYHLHLIVQQSFLSTTDTTLCAPSFTFRGHIYTQSGVYDDSLRSSIGCDSIYRLNLTLNKSVITDVEIDACQGDSVLIRGRYIPASGIYYDTLVSRTGCDSIIRYKFNILATYDYYQNATICQGETFLFHGQPLSFPGDYTHTYKTVGGCDSSYHLHLTVVPAYHFIVDTNVCGTSFIYRNRTYTQSGTYYDTLASVAGCDSVYQLNLTLNKPSSVVDIMHSLCYGDSVTIRGRVISSDTTFIDTLSTKHGCDSVVRYVVIVNYPYVHYDTIGICRGEIYNYHGLPVTKAGDYVQSFKSIGGCDSLYYLHVTLQDAFLFVTDTTLCGNKFEFRGHEYTESGVYDDSLRSVNGCDSIYRLNLTLNHYYKSDVRINVCEGDSFTISGKHIPATGIYYDTLISRSGCDSIIRYIFNVHRKYDFYQSANICLGDTFLFHGSKLSYPGDYTHVYQAVSGCDSTYHLHLEVSTALRFVVDTFLCGATFVFHNRTYTESGVYFDTIPAENGCDSIYQLNLTLNHPSPISDIVVNLCQNDSFFLRGKYIPSTSIYYDSLINSSGCDSIVRYIFIVHPTYDVYDTVSICKGDYYDFDGRKLTEDGDYSLVYTTVRGCDSTVHLHLTTRPSYFAVVDTSLCANFFAFNHHIYTESGTYTDTLSTTLGCDSIIQLNLNLYHEVPVTELYMSICHGDSFAISGVPVVTPGVYYDTLLNHHGCDSVLRYIVSFMPSYQFFDTVTICDHDSYVYHGQTISASGNYIISFKTKEGCDSSYHLHLTVNPSYLFVTDTIACGHVFRFRERDYTESGVYYDSLRTVNGCDSVYRLNLTLYEPVITDVRLDVCQGDSAYISGRLVPASGVYCDTFVSHRGCDSVVRYIFNVHNTFEMYQSVTICSNDTFDFYGQRITMAGDYEKVFKTAYGCDSIYHLHLEINPSYFFVIDTVVCGSTFRYRTKDYTSSGTYYDTLRTIYSCDSIYQLNLTLYPNVVTDINIDACDGDSVIIGGRYLPAQGVYYDTLVSHFGCDSIVRYIFNVHNRFETYVTASICPGDVYDFHGLKLYQAGDYIKTYRTRYGCDSIYHLHLTVNPSYLFVIDTAVCGHTFRFNGKDYDTTGIYYDSLRTVSGCDSVYKIILDLTVPQVTDYYLDVCQGASVFIHDTLIAAEGEYSDTIYLPDGCYAVERYIFNVHPNVEVFDTTQICYGDSILFHGMVVRYAGDYQTDDTTIYGCDSIYHLHVIVNPSYLFVIDTAVCGYSFRFNDRDYIESGVYYDSLRAIGGCDSVYKIILRLTPPQVNDFYVDVCQGSTFVIRDTVIQAVGVYNDTIALPDGCYAVDRYAFNVHPVMEFFDTVNVCHGDSVPFCDIIVTSSGDYVRSLKSVYGCDSVHHLHAVFNPSYYFVIDTAVCGYSFRFNDHDFTESGVYYDSMSTVNGCDSVYKIILNLTFPEIHDFYVDVCEGSSVVIRDSLIQAVGEYRDSVLLPNGCYYIDRYIFNVHPNIEVFDTIHLCYGDSLMFQGKMIGSPGDYFIHDTTVYGCDSVYHLFLIVHPTYYVEHDTSICADDVFILDNIQRRTSGTYIQNFKTRFGCDSTIAYNLTVHDTTHTEQHAKICEGQTFQLHGKTYTEAGIYNDTTQNEYGCDEIITLYLTVSTKYDIQMQETVCANELPFVWEGLNVKYPGQYMAKYQSIDGCDSTLTLNLTVKPTPQTYDSVYNCSSGNYHWNDSLIVLPGDYVDTLRTFDGCDSIIHLHYDTLPLVRLTIATICKGDVYYYRGNGYSLQGVYDVIAPASGINCDTIYRLNLTVDTTAGYFEKRVDTCNVTGYMFGGRLLTETGIYYDTTLNANGCQTITKLNLTLGYDVLVEKYFEICQGSSISFRGHTYTKSGTYLDSLVSTTGCDSVYKIVVNVMPVFVIDYDSLYVCGPNDSVLFNKTWYHAGVYYFDDPYSTEPCPTRYRLVVTDNSYRFDTVVTVCKSDLPFVHPHTHKSYYTSGSYDVSYATVHGCDSTYHLDLTVNPEPRHDTFDTICQGESYYFNGRYYTTDVVVIDTLMSALLCDSIDILHLKMIPNRDTTFKSICQGDNYRWPVNNVTYNASGYYQYVDSTSTDRCPTIYVLALTVVPPVNIGVVDVTYACADDSEYFMDVNILPGSTPRIIRVFYDQNAINAGFEDYVDSFIGRRFSLPMPLSYSRYGDSLYYVRPGIYNVRIQFDNGVCRPEFSEINTSVEVRYPSFVLEQNWNDVVAVTRYNHHDNTGADDSYTFSSFEWLIDGVLVPGATRSYYYKENYSLVGHNVQARLTRTGENTGVLTCPLYIVPMQENGDYPVVNGPVNMLRSSNPVTTFSATESGRYTIYSVSGHLISTGRFDADTDVNITFPSIVGCYILHVETEHLLENYKILVY